jgi:hypothetical protein
VVRIVGSFVAGIMICVHGGSEADAELSRG